MNDGAKINEIAERVARIETLLTEYVKNLETVNKRLDSHSHRLDELERNQNQAVGAALTTKWFVGTMLTSVTVACAVAKLIL